MKTRLIGLCFCLAAAFGGLATNAFAVSDGGDEILRKYSAFDLNGDGSQEIHSLAQVESTPDLSSPASDARLLLVLVEQRLLDNSKRLPRAEGGLLARLHDYSAALHRDGWAPIIVSADVYRGSVHQDGRTVLALRRVLQDFKKRYPQFGGAVFVGSFPEPTIVRRWLWKHADRAVTFGDVKYNTKGGPAATWLAINPEMICGRSDVVLCDLDGKWEEIYRHEPTEVEVVRLLPEEKLENWPTPETPIVTSQFSLGKRTYEDFFFIDDAQYSRELAPDGKLIFKGTYELRLPEVGDAERKDPNPLARSEIMVSRINPLHVAVTLPARCLDPEGRPIAVAKEHGNPNQQFVRDEALELRLLCEYFDRNLAHRAGQAPQESHRVALMTTDLQTPSKAYFQKTSKELGGLIEFPKSTALDFARFMTTPAIIKGVSAHSDPSRSVLMKGYDAAALDALCGGHYWNWREKENEFAPTYNDPRVRNAAHFALLRTLWENDKLAGAGSCFYIHGGCEVNSPSGAARHAYHDPAYSDHTQIAECFMYYGNGLALLGRSKVFYDIPSGFENSFTTQKGNFGDVLRGYFDIESQNARLAKSVASRNRAYFWSILGDWTLRLNHSLKRP